MFGNASVVAGAVLVLQEIDRLKQEEEDRKLALSLQEEQSTIAPPSATNPFASTLDAGRTYSAPQVSLIVCSKAKQCIAQILFGCLVLTCTCAIWVVRSLCVQVCGFELACVPCFMATLLVLHATACCSLTFVL